MNKKAFSLVELIVGITISMILMVSVGIFIGNGMQNVFQQQLVLENTDNMTDFAGELHSSFNLIQTGSFTPITTSSGVLFKRGQNFSEGGFSYIGTENIDGIYCDTDAENTVTKSIYLKSFIPLEENGEDIFSNYNDILTASAGTYRSYQKEHVIKDSSNNIVVGKGVFGDGFTNGSNGVDVYLNSPTGLALDAANNSLYISDTLNNRIIHYDTSTNIVNIILDKNNGLNEPTGLYYNNNELYISNSGNGEILKYSSNSSVDKSINFDFRVNQDINNIKKIELYMFSGITGITEPNDKTDFTFSGLSKSTDYFTTNGNKATYWFSNFANRYENTANTPCGSNYESYYEEGGEIIRESLTGCNFATGTLAKYRSSSSQSVSSGANLRIETSNDIAGTDFSNPGNYFAKLNIVGDTTYSNYLPLFTSSDSNLLTSDDNTLEVIQTGLNYPTGIWGVSNYNQFGDGSYSNLAYDNNDSVLGTPIESINTSINGNILNLIFKYYKRYNCYNLDDKNERTYILKKNLN